MIRDSNEKNPKYRVGYLFLILSKRMKSFARTDGRIFLYEKPVRQIVRQDKSVILRERIARVWSFYLPVIGSGVHKIHLPAEECFSFSLSLSSLKVRACLVENKADRDVKPGDFRTPLFTVFLFRHYEWIPR